MKGLDVLSDTVRMLAGRMDYLTSRHDVATQNIANIETPNYKSRDVIFEGYVTESMQNEALSSSSFKPKTSVAVSSAQGNDRGNNVNFEEQTALMTDNSIEFMTVSEATKRYLNMMRLVASDR